MLFKIARYEFKYMVRSPQTIVGFAVFFLLPFFAMVSSNVQIGGGGNVMVNSPFAIMQTLLIMSVFSIFLVPAYVANAVLKDIDHKMDGIIFSTPISKSDYLFGRFFGAFGALLVTLLAMPLGMLVGTFWGGLTGSIDPETLAPTNLGHYVYTYFALVTPGLLAMSAIMFAITVMSRSVMYTYLGAMGLLMLYFIGLSFFREPEHRELLAIVDPFMARTLQEVGRYWTAAERNTLLMGYEGVVLTNRLIWIGASIVLIGLSYAVFSFRAPAKLPKEKSDKKAKAKPVTLQAPRITPAWESGYWRQLFIRTKFEVSSVLKSYPFYIIVLFSLFIIVTALFNRSVGYGLDAVPVSRLMVQSIRGLDLAFIVIIIFYSADIIWRERKDGIHEIIDATPVPGMVFVVSKLASLAIVLTIIAAIGIFIAISVQVLNGQSAIEIGLYLHRGFLHFVYPFLLIAALSVFIQVLVKNRFVGMILMVVYLIGSIILSQFGFEHPLYFYGSSIATPLSDLNGSGRFIEGDYWLQFYWTCFAILMLMVSYMLWNRGTLQPLRYRMRALRAFKKPIAAGFAFIAFVGFVGSGGFIFYNTNILNDYVTGDEREQLAVDYENKYRQYENLPMPRTIDVKVDVDLYPYERRIETRGTHVLENKTGETIETVHIVFPRGVKVPAVELEAASLESVDKDFNYYIFILDRPMKSGERRSLAFETLIDQKGFAHSGNSVTLVRNGTFINNADITPYIGFFPGGMLQDRNTRRQHDLPPLPRTPKLEDESQHGNNYLRQDSDFVTFETTVSTVASQTAIAPGYLEKEWEANGRRYFHYKMDAPILNFYSYLSADYEVVRDEFDGINVEVYHHAPHTYNVQRMIDSVRDSVRYFSKAFSPYQHKQVRILEFPAYRSFAQAFPNTIPYSEGIGFIADITGEDDIDLAYYVTAHEVAHQWWAHQVMSANTQGGTMLIETFAQYSALLVMEQKYGKDQMRKFLKFELDNYLSNRGSDPEGELPLYRVENQAYIHYRKGSVVMYALRDYLGEETVNRALSRLIKETGFSSTPYPTSLDLLRILREEAGPEYDQLITDLFERITLFDLKAEGATVVEMEDGRFKVSLTIDAAKFEADNEGNETALTLDDMIDIGVFTADPGDSDFDSENVLYMKKHKINSDTKTVEIIVDGQPTFVGIDPYNKLVDRNSNDNIKSVSTTTLASASE
ncbi:M1 family aminopeptidase [Kordiimonas sp. SCSIO 12610]|uniref:ABC transporter permease/M1 family aminopeptidase n=1 Tax=Kordiimonas sp. SCSIO 12610 TaxID=2829597 RepID=UPI00210E25E6|nr:M1 family aminopeptidase [Kordiimonas sp. SCSIO 12610]UTW54737.1 ABC transporter permease [Kordiimonas sp. SCSIO 12610]